MATDDSSGTLDAYIDRMARTIKALHGEAAPQGDGASADGPRLEAAKALEELQTALEELRVAEEELRQQNEELAATRQALEEEQKRYRDLFELAPNAYLLTDPFGIIREANRTAARLLNIPAHHLAGKPLAVFVAKDDRAAFRDHLNGMLQTEPRQEWEVHLCPRHLAPLEAQLTVALERSPAGEPVALRWLLRDVTRQKQEERLAAIGWTAACLAHESRNALQRSQACLERLTWKLQDRPETLDLVSRAQRAQNDLLRMFEDVRSIAAPIMLERTPCDLAEVWREAWGQLASLCEGRPVQLREHAGELDRVCSVDRFRLQQVFRNVLENTLAACTDPVEIDVSCGATVLDNKPAIQVAVSDNGPGLTEEQARRIFEPFYTTKARGTGLGMAIAARIVQAHGGRIAAGRSAQGGAEIRLTLPRR